MPVYEVFVTQVSSAVMYVEAEDEKELQNALEDIGLDELILDYTNDSVEADLIQDSDVLVPDYRVIDGELVEVEE